jgi:hypothetical protein
MRLRDYPKWDDPLRESILYRRNGKIRRRRMSAYRSVPVKRRAWYVTLTATVADQERDFGSHDLVAGFMFEPQAFWCLSRRKARALVNADLAAGGSGTMFPVEYRLCPVCGRQLLGAEAHHYRLKQMAPAHTWLFPEGPACSADCKRSRRGPGGQPIDSKRGRKPA